MFILGMRQELSAAVVIGKHACFTSMFICVFLCFHVNTSVFFTMLCVSVCHPVFAESMANLQNKLLQQSASIFSHLVVFESFLSRAMHLSILNWNSEFPLDSNFTMMNNFDHMYLLQTLNSCFILHIKINWFLDAVKTFVVFEGARCIYAGRRPGLWREIGGGRLCQIKSSSFQPLSSSLSLSSSSLW